jgi:hypothetical protein
MTVGLVEEVRVAPEGAAPAPPAGLRVWLRDLLRHKERVQPTRSPEEVEQERVARLEEVRAQLEEARNLIEKGWVQDAWFAIRDRQGRLRPIGPFGFGLLRRGDVAGACLVGAVVHATWTHRPGVDATAAAPALDMLWDSLQEVRGVASASPVAASRDVRAARVRDLTRWNDRPGRSRDEVLELLDVAVSRTIMAAVEPARRT